MAKADMITYTAPDGTTRNSSVKVYTHALAVFVPSMPWDAPRVVSFHTSYKAATNASPKGYPKGARRLVVPVTTDSSTDDEWARAIGNLRTAQDIDNIPAMKIAQAEEYLASQREYLEKCETDYRLRNTTKYISEADLLRFIENAQRRMRDAEIKLDTVKQEYAPKPEPAVEKPKEPKKLNRAVFIREVNLALRNATIGGTSLTYTPSDIPVTVERTSQDSYKSVKVGVGGGDFIEIHIPFTSRMRRQIVLRIWDLIDLMDR